MLPEPEPPQALSSLWDVIIVGTGMGGATLGHALARLGKRVLFCERGRLHRKDAGVSGTYPEMRQPHSPVTPAMLQAAGRCGDTVVDETGRRARRFVPVIGAGAGGSSALFGMAMERFAPSDFEPGLHHPAVGSTLETAWPVDFQTFAPFYDEAEVLYRVRGAPDPLTPTSGPRPTLMQPPPLTPGGRAMGTFLEGRGMHPYRLPMACEFVGGCECCQGFLCPRACKNDSARICLAPAIESFGACLLDQCEVVRVQAERSRVTGVACRRLGREFTLRAEVVVLAAGALHTPRLLLRSTSADWPTGLANRSGRVGRNLMRHLIDLYLVELDPPAGGPLENRFKEWAFNDFYLSDRGKLGSVQSFGRLPPAPMLLESMRQDMRQGPFRPLDRLMPLAAPALRRILDGMVNGTVALATLLEDLPYADNRVLPPRPGERHDAPLRFTYSVNAYEDQRITAFRRHMKKMLGPARWRLVKQAHNNERIAHACGTCRFGNDPTTSVLDRNNRAHDLDNLYVVDSSFFPSSGGTNPSLTIAANALRVARHLASR